MPKKQKFKIKEQLAVIYARFSCDKQRDESIEDQLRVCMEYAREHGITIVGTYCDYALSGRTDHRPQFLKMIEDSKNGDFNTVLLWKMDRFARNRWDSAIYKKELHNNGVTVISATEPIPEGGGGIIMESLYEGMAEMYSVQISQNVKRAARGNALKNKSNGGNLLFGYKVNPETRLYELDEAQAPIVEEIFNMAAAGKDVISILNWTSSMGLKLTRSRIYTMLHNERYTGTYIYSDIRNEDGMPAIISKEKFDAVQLRYAKPGSKQRHPHKNYLFSKRCFCGKCGSTCTGESSRKSVADGHRMYYYYSCQGHKLRHSCDKKRVRADIVEEAAYRVLADLLLQPDLMQHFIKAALNYQQSIQEDTPEEKLAKRRLSEVQTRKNNLLEAIEQGILTASTAVRLKELEAEEEDLKIKLKNFSKKGSVGKLSAGHIEFFLNQLKNENLKSEMFVKSLFQDLICKVFLFDDHITLVYNLQNNPKESISLEELLEIKNPESRMVTGFKQNKNATKPEFDSVNIWLPE